MKKTVIQCNTLQSSQEWIAADHGFGRRRHITISMLLRMPDWPLSLRLLFPANLPSILSYPFYTRRKKKQKASKSHPF